MKKPLLFVMFVIVVITGCSTRYSYNKYGASEQQRNKDGYECRKEATFRSSNANVNAYGGTASSGVELHIPTMIACLKARGYTVKKA